MIEIVNVPQANDSMIYFVVQGDGISSEVTAKLNKDPFNMSFNNIPSGVTISIDPDNGTAAGVISIVDADTILTVTFSQPPPADATLGIPAALFWNSL
jgi:hypothetical protein